MNYWTSSSKVRAPYRKKSKLTEASLARARRSAPRRLNVELKCMPTDASERAKDAGPVGLVDLASSNAQWNPDSIGVRKDWATVHLGTVTVTDRAGANIQARLWKHTGSWIRNLYFDYVQVREVGAREEEEYARSWWHVDSTKRDGAGGEGGGRKSWSFW